MMIIIEDHNTFLRFLSFWSFVKSLDLFYGNSISLLKSIVLIFWGDRIVSKF